MRSDRLVLSATLLCVSGACDLAPRRAPTPDLLLVNGKVFTSDTARPWAQAVAVGGERIVAVGSTTDMRALAGPSTRIIDVGGRVVVPGFNDAHDHISGGTPGIGISVGAGVTDPTPATILDSLRLTVGRVPAGTWIRSDIWTRAFDDTTLRRAALDRVAPRHPIMLYMPTGHGLVLNTMALRALGIRDAEPDPLGGWYERDATGRLTGRLDEYAGWRARRTHRASVPETTMVATMQRFAESELRLGITSVQDMTLNFEPATAVRVLRAANLPLRVRLFKFSVPTGTSMNLDEWEGLPSQPAPLVTIAGRKWILDGTPIEGLMLTRGPQPGRPGWHGRLDFPVDSVRAMLARALGTREQLAVHVVGDSATALVLSLMESLAPDSAWRAHRVRLEHAAVAALRDLWPRAVAKGVVLVGNLQLLPPPVVARAMPKVVLDTIAASLEPVVAQTFPLALGSDAVSRSPFNGMYSALSLPTASHPPREMLVRAYTWGSAFAEFADDEKGTITPGKLADIAVLSQDIFTIPVEALPKTESVLTLLGGRVVWDAKVPSVSGSSP